MENRPIIYFDSYFDSYSDIIEMKGYCDNVIVRMPDMSEYKLYFYDPIRLKQDIEEENFIAIPNLIVVLDVTRKNMEDAIYKAWKNGYFLSLKPL